MKWGEQLQACADCGDVLVLEYLPSSFLRPLCPTCLHTEADRLKKAAEIWLLEQMFSRSAAPFNKLRMAHARLKREAR
jgi:hypothetical protein